MITQVLASTLVPLAETETTIGAFGLVFDNKVSTGNLLTIGTVVVGVVSWLIARYRAAENEKKRAARDGAMRLLLRYLRRLDSDDIGDDELRAKFNGADAEATNLRKGYCGYDFKLDPVEFETAIYALDWEGKIDFPKRNRIAFRVDRRIDPARRFVPTEDDANAVFDLLETLSKEDADEWKLRDVAVTAMMMDAKRAAKTIRTLLHSGDEATRRKIVSVLERLIAD